MVRWPVRSYRAVFENYDSRIQDFLQTLGNLDTTFSCAQNYFFQNNGKIFTSIWPSFYGKSIKYCTFEEIDNLVVK